MNTNRSVSWLAALLALVMLVSGCGTTSQPLRPTLTPTLKITLTRTTIPTRTSTPTRTLSPTPIGAMFAPTPTRAPTVSSAQMRDWHDLCQQAVSQPVTSIKLRYPPNNGAVYVFETESQGELLDRHLDQVSVIHPAAPKFLMCIQKSTVHAFNYSGGIEGLNRVWDVTFIDISSQRSFYRTHLVGPNPPSFITVPKGTTMYTGSDPVDKLLSEAIACCTDLSPLTAYETNAILGLAFSPDGQKLLVDVSDSQTIRLNERELSNFGKTISLTMKGNFKSGIAFTNQLFYTPDGNGVAYKGSSSSLQSSLYYLQINRSKSENQLTLVSSAPCESMGCLAGPVLPGNIIRRGPCEWRLGSRLTCTLRPEVTGKVIASSETGDWLAFEGELVIPATPTPVPTLKATPTRSRSTPHPTTVKVWSSAAGEVIGEIVSSTPATKDPEVIFSPDGSLLAVDFGSLLEIWRTSPLERTATVSNYNLLVFSPDNTRLVGILSSGKVDIFDLPSRRYVGTENFDIGAITLAVFHPDSKQLVVASNHFVRIKELP